MHLFALKLVTFQNLFIQTNVSQKWPKQTFQKYEYISLGIYIESLARWQLKIRDLYRVDDIRLHEFKDLTAVSPTAF